MKKCLRKLQRMPTLRRVRRSFSVVGALMLGVSFIQLEAMDPGLILAETATEKVIGGKVIGGEAAEIAEKKLAAEAVADAKKGAPLRPPLERNPNRYAEEIALQQATQRSQNMRNIAAAIDVKIPNVEYAILNLNPDALNTLSPDAAREAVAREYAKMRREFNPRTDTTTGRQYDEMAGMTPSQAREFQARVRATRQEVDKAFNKINAKLTPPISDDELFKIRTEIGAAEDKLALENEIYAKSIGKNHAEFAFRRAWVRNREMQRVLNPDANAYEVLGLQANATPKEIKAAYDELKSKYRWDPNPKGDPRGLYHYYDQFHEAADMTPTQKAQFFRRVRNCDTIVEMAYDKLKDAESLEAIAEKTAQTAHEAEIVAAATRARTNFRQAESKLEQAQEALAKSQTSAEEVARLQTARDNAFKEAAFAGAQEAKQVAEQKLAEATQELDAAEKDATLDHRKLSKAEKDAKEEDIRRKFEAEKNAREELIQVTAKLDKAKKEFEAIPESAKQKVTVQTQVQAVVEVPAAKPTAEVTAEVKQTLKPKELSDRLVALRQAEMSRILRPSANPYEILGLKATATESEIKAARDRLVDQYTPMKFGEKDITTAQADACRINIHRAYADLSSPDTVQAAMKTKELDAALEKSKLQSSLERAKIQLQRVKATKSSEADIADADEQLQVVQDQMDAINATLAQHEAEAKLAVAAQEMGTALKNPNLSGQQMREIFNKEKALQQEVTKARDLSNIRRIKAEESQAQRLKKLQQNYGEISPEQQAAYKASGTKKSFKKWWRGLSRKQRNVIKYGGAGTVAVIGISTIAAEASK